MWKTSSLLLKSFIIQLLNKNTPKNNSAALLFTDKALCYVGWLAYPTTRLASCFDYSFRSFHSVSWHVLCMKYERIFFTWGLLNTVGAAFVKVYLFFYWNNQESGAPHPENRVRPRSDCENNVEHTYKSTCIVVWGDIEILIISVICVSSFYSISVQ